MKGGENMTDKETVSLFRTSPRTRNEQEFLESGMWQISMNIMQDGKAERRTHATNHVLQEMFGEGSADPKERHAQRQIATSVATHRRKEQGRKDKLDRAHKKAQ